MTAVNVTLLGHASVLVELRGTNCLMDPVFGDPFEEGAVASCPKRLVYPDRLPHIDILIISHRHPDHFDIPSLARISRDCDVICPVDPLIAYTLKQLGFSRIHPVQPMAPIFSPEFELYPTKSEVKSVREFGMVFADASGVFWNQVDSFLAPETITAVANRFGRTDLLFAMYASQTFDFLEDRSTRFPFEIHARNLETARRIGPGMTVPASAGFRFAGQAVALNPFLFPISRDRFITDLHRLDNGIRAEIVNPGDVLVIDAGSVEHRLGTSDAAVMVEGDTHLIHFDITQSVPALGDPNPEGYSLGTLEEACDRTIRSALFDYASGGYVTADKVVEAYRERRVRYAIEIVFPGGSVAHYCIVFADHHPELLTGQGEFPSADMVHRIAASALVDWVRNRKSYFYVRAYSRRHSLLYRLDRKDGEVHAIPYDLPDLLMHYVLNAAEGSATAAKTWVDHQLSDVGSPH